jgi:hypothetical protein
MKATADRANRFRDSSVNAASENGLDRVHPPMAISVFR